MSDVFGGTSRAIAADDIRVIEGRYVRVLAGNHDAIANIDITIIIHRTSCVCWRVNNSSVFRDTNWNSIFSSPGSSKGRIDIGIVVFSGPRYC